MIRDKGKQDSLRMKRGTEAKSGGTTAKFRNSRYLSKVTLYVRPDQIIAIEAIQLEERKRTGVRPDKSALVQEGLDLLIGKYKPKR